MPEKGKGNSKVLPSMNWLNLQKKKSSARTENEDNSQAHTSKKRQKLNNGLAKNKFARLSMSSNRSESPSSPAQSVEPPSTRIVPQAVSEIKNGESIAALQEMVLGHMEYTENHKLPGKYLALDCEMVGLGIDGAESSLARVSLVNFYGAVIMDEFVKQKERVVDYRTQWSGIRPSDMVNAKPFEEVQKKIADLLKDRILVAHAVQNDLKALLLSHPRPQIRDTQYYAHKFQLCKTKRVALRNLVKQEIGLTIQSGEHSSVTDARATMAIYRLHKKEWEKNSRPLHLPTNKSAPAASSSSSNKRKEMSDSESESDSDEEEKGSTKAATLKQIPSPKAKGKMKASSGFPGGGRKGVSSGLSTVVRRAGKAVSKGGSSDAVQPKAKSEWWKTLPGSMPSSTGAKGSVTVAISR
ncbi:ribonuclease H-like protein [Agrocybe pediades]|nr:ribonuclease H-like protein [Agrocybe pediades]